MLFHHKALTYLQLNKKKQWNFPRKREKHFFTPIILSVRIDPEEKLTEIFSMLLSGVALALWLLPQNSIFDGTSKETLQHSFKLILAILAKDKKTAAPALKHS